MHINRTFLFVAFISLLATVQNVSAQFPADKKQQFASLGDFPLENGQRIIDCKIGYRTFGKLNAARTNAVIYPTGGGTTTFMMQLFGAGADVDTTKFYLILIDALGNGVSSSPSNSSSQPKTSFPQFTIRDMVNTQHKMLTEKMNIKHLAAVVGGSMGGIQALQWAVSYPDFMDKVVAIEATPKVSAYDMLWMQTYVDAVKSDTGYHGGNYTVNPAMPVATHLVQLVLTTPAFFNRSVQADSLASYFGMLEKSPFKVDANNMLWQTKAVMMHDISAKSGGTMESAAKTIKAKLLIVANKQDHNVSQTLAIQFAELTKAELVVMDNDMGHIIFGEKTVIEATRKFLSQ